MISITGLHYSYNSSSSAILDGIDLDIAQGEHVALIGPNGCGKTTLARHLNGLLTPQRGRVIIDGMDTQNKHQLGDIRRRVGMVFQNPENQIVGMTVEEDIAFGPGNQQTPSSEIQAIVRESLATVGLSGYELRHPYSLSGGEKQLLALAGILATKPQYIVLDEPTSSLDPASRAIVLAQIKTLNDMGIAIIHITHTMDDIVSSHRVVALAQGKIAAQGTPLEILCNADLLSSLGLAPSPIVQLMDRLHKATGTINPAALTIDQAFSHITNYIRRLNGTS
jgi:biotin transport system ATP-binding protein